MSDFLKLNPNLTLAKQSINPVILGVPSNKSKVVPQSKDNAGEHLSNNVKFDFLTLLFARAILSVAKMDNSDDGGVVLLEDDSLDPSSREIEKRISILSEKLEDTITAVYEIGKRKLAEWVDEKAHGRIDKTILAIHDKKVNLEFLAVNVLFINFCDYRGDKKLLKEMQWIRDDEKNIMEILTLFDETNVGFLDGESFESALEIIEHIKTGRSATVMSQKASA